MAIASGAQSYIAYKVESAYGETPPVGSNQADKGIPLVSENLVESINRFISEEIRQDRATSGIRGGNLGNAGTITNEFGVKRNGRMLQALMAGGNADPTPTGVTETTISVDTALSISRGEYVATDDNPNETYVVINGVSNGMTMKTQINAVTTGTPTVGVDYTLATSGAVVRYVGSNPTLTRHVIVPGSISGNGLRFVKAIKGGDANKFIALAGGRVNTLGLNIPQEGIVRADWGVLGLRSFSSDTENDYATTLTYPSGSPAAGLDAWVNILSTTGASSPANIGYGVTRPVREASINITNNIDDSVYAIGDRFRKGLPDSRREVTGNLTMYFEDASEYDFFLGETTVEVRWVFVDPEGSVCQIKLPECQLTGSGTPTVQGAGVMTASYEFTAFKSSASNDIEITLTGANFGTLD